MIRLLLWLLIPLFLCAATSPPLNIHITVTATGTETVFDHNGAPWSFFNQVPAINYDNGGKNFGYNVPVPGCQGATCVSGASTYRADDVNFKASTFAGIAYQLGSSAIPNSYNYQINMSQAGPYKISLWLGDTSTGGSWNVLVDGTVVTTVATPNTGDFGTFQQVTSGNFTVATGNHKLTLLCNGGDVNFNGCGDIVAWQGAISGGAIACDVGPNYVGTIPAAAMAAFGSSPRCLMNLDFTNAAFSSIGSWLDCFGAGSPIMWKHSSEGSTAPCDSTHFAMVTDGGVQVFRMQFPAADIGAGITQVEIDSSTNGFGSAQSVSGTTMPVSNYTEFVSRVGAINTYSSSGGNTTSQLMWAPFYYQPSNGNNDTFLEEDWGEMSDGVSGSPNPTALNSAGGWWNCGGVIGLCNPYPFGLGPVPTQANAPQLTYNTYGMLVTGDGSAAIAMCNYFGAGIVTGLQHSNWISCQPGNWNNPGGGGSFVRNHMLLPLGYGHTQGSGTVALSATQSVFIQRVTVWTCPGGGVPPGGSTVGNQCNVTALSTSPPL